MCLIKAFCRGHRGAALPSMNELFIFLARFQHKMKCFLTDLSVLLCIHLPAHGQKHLRLEDFKAPAYALTRFAVS